MIVRVWRHCYATLGAYYVVWMLFGWRAIWRHWARAALAFCQRFARLTIRRPPP